MCKESNSLLDIPVFPSVKNEIETSLTGKIFGDTLDKSNVVVLSMPEVVVVLGRCELLKRLEKN